MRFRQATMDDLDKLMEIVKQAQDYFKDAGIDQWQDGYPQRELMESDIAQNISYVLEKDNKVCAVMSVLFDGEETYHEIYKGQWMSDGDYVAIHRIAVDSEYKGLGLAPYMIRQVEELCLQKNIHSIKVDTHRDNIVMQKMLQKNGFQYCGIIYLEDRSERVAFEKIL